MYLTTRIFITLSAIVRKWNVRVVEDGTNLIPSILSNGIQTPLMVDGDDNGSSGLIRGHRRYHALTQIRDAGTEGLSDEQTVVWNRLFDEASEGYEGIPVDSIKGASEAELTRLHIDQDQQPLRFITELVKVAAALFGRGGMREFDAAEHMAGMLDAILPPRGKKYAEILAAKEAGNTAEYRRLNGEFRRGTIQFLKRVAYLPLQVLWALEWQETRRIPEGCSLVEHEFPKITRATALSLEKAFQSDMEIKDDATGVCPFSTVDTGPNFDAEWRKLVDDANEAETTTATRQKAMSGKEIAESAGQFRSAGIKSLCAKHSGATAEVDPKVTDGLLFYAELVSTGNPKLWAKVVEAGDKLNEKRLEVAKANVAKQLQKQAAADLAKVESKATPIA